MKAKKVFLIWARDRGWEVDQIRLALSEMEFENVEVKKKKDLLELADRLCYFCYRESTDDFIDEEHFSIRDKRALRRLEKEAVSSYGTDGTSIWHTRATVLANEFYIKIQTKFFQRELWEILKKNEKRNG